MTKYLFAPSIKVLFGNVGPKTAEIVGVGDSMPGDRYRTLATDHLTITVAQIHRRRFSKCPDT